MKKIVFTFLLLIFANPVFTAGLFKPNIIEVNEIADTVVIAKKNAFSKAKRQAWFNLIKIVGASKTNSVGNISEDDIDSMIETIDVSGEKARSKRYIANITIYFNPKKVRSYLRSNNIVFVEERGFPVLVIPVYEQDGITYIYEQSNIWEKALLDNPKKDGLLPIVLAESGVKNSLKIDKFTLKTEEKLLKTSKSYGVEGVVIAKVSVIPSKIGLHMRLTYHSIGGFLENQIGLQDFKSKSKDKQRLLKRITNDFYILLESMWQKKIKNNKSIGKNTQIIIMSTQNEAELKSLEKKLLEFENIENVELISLNGGLAEFKITFRGVIKKLKIAFERLGYIIDNKYNKWIVKSP